MSEEKKLPMKTSSSTPSEVDGSVEQFLEFTENIAEAARYKAETEQKTIEIQDRENERRFQYHIKKLESDNIMYEKYAAERSRYKWIFSVFALFIIIGAFYFITVGKTEDYMKFLTPVLSMVLGAIGGYGYGKSTSNNIPVKDNDE